MNKAAAATYPEQDGGGGEAEASALGGGGQVRLHFLREKTRIRTHLTPAALKGGDSAPPGHLSDLVEPPVGALDLELGLDLELQLLLLEVHQVPLVLQPGLAPLPELQEEGDCGTDRSRVRARLCVRPGAASPTYPRFP